MKSSTDLQLTQMNLEMRINEQLEAAIERKFEMLNVEVSEAERTRAIQNLKEMAS